MGFYLLIQFIFCFIKLSCPTEYKDILEEIGSSRSKFESSVWCHETEISGLQCRFENLCYDSTVGSNVFVHGPGSVISGLKSLHVLNSQLYLSSVLGHNGFLPSISVVPSLKFNSRLYRFYNNTSIYMSQFKHDNIYHVFHDDLIPLYFTVRGSAISGSKSLVLLGRSSDQYMKLYNIFVDDVILPNNSFIDRFCHSYSIIGLDKFSVWYDYGYDKLPHTKIQPFFNHFHLKQFTNYVKLKLGIPGFQHTTSCTSVLFVRKRTRLILNELELGQKMISVLSKFRQYRTCPLKIISLEDNSLESIIETVSSAKVMVGMHGSAMIFSIFLEQKSNLLELWPYHLRPSAATMFRAVTQLESSQVSYGAWCNNRWENSVLNLEQLPNDISFSRSLVDSVIAELRENDLGGIKCCHSPRWIARLAQDMIVDLESFGHALADTLLKHDYAPKWSPTTIPGRPATARCIVTNLNTKDLFHLYIQEKETLGCDEYELIIKTGDSNHFSYVIKRVTYFSIELDKIFSEGDFVSVWLSIICGTIVGPPAYISCTRIKSDKEVRSVVYDFHTRVYIFLRPLQRSFSVILFLFLL